MSDSNTTHEAPSYDDVNTPVIVLVGAISALVTLLTIMFVQGLCYHWQNSFLIRNASGVEAMPSVVEIEAQKEELVKSPVPISLAMEKVVSKYGK